MAGHKSYKNKKNKRPRSSSDGEASKRHRAMMTTQGNPEQENIPQASNTPEATLKDGITHGTTTQSASTQDTTTHTTTQDGQHLTTQDSTTQHSTTQHSTTQHSTTQHSTIQDSTTQDSTTQDSTTQHSTTQDSTTQDSTTQGTTTRRTTTPGTTTPKPARKKPISQEQKMVTQEVTCFLQARIPPVSSAHLYDILMGTSIIYSRLCRDRGYRFLDFASYFFLRNPIRLGRYTSSFDGTRVWALVLGALEDRGKSIAEELCSRGIDVVLQGPPRKLGELYALASDLRDHWPQCRTRVLGHCKSDGACDDSHLERCTHGLEDIHLRIVINAMGYAGTTEPEDSDETSEDWLESAEPYRLELLFEPDDFVSDDLILDDDTTPKDLGERRDRNIRFMTAITRMVRPLLTKHGRPSIIVNASDCGAKFLELLYVTIYSSGAASCLKVREVVENYAVEISHDHSVGIPPVDKADGVHNARPIECETESILLSSKSMDAWYWPWWPNVQRYMSWRLPRFLWTREYPKQRRLRFAPDPRPAPSNRFGMIW